MHCVTAFPLSDVDLTLCDSLHLPNERERVLQALWVNATNSPGSEEQRAYQLHVGGPNKCVHVIKYLKVFSC